LRTGYLIVVIYLLSANSVNWISKVNFHKRKVKHFSRLRETDQNANNREMLAATCDEPAVVREEWRRRDVATSRSTRTSLRPTSGTSVDDGRRRRSKGATTAASGQLDTAARRRSSHHRVDSSRDASECRRRRSCHDDVDRCSSVLLDERETNTSTSPTNAVTGVTLAKYNVKN